MSAVTLKILNRESVVLKYCEKGFIWFGVPKDFVGRLNHWNNIKSVNKDPEGLFQLGKHIIGLCICMCVCVGVREWQSIHPTEAVYL